MDLCGLMMITLFNRQYFLFYRGFRLNFLEKPCGSMSFVKVCGRDKGCACSVTEFKRTQIITLKSQLLKIIAFKLSLPEIVQKRTFFLWIHGPADCSHTKSTCEVFKMPTIFKTQLNECRRNALNSAGLWNKAVIHRLCFFLFLRSKSWSNK